MIMKAKEREDLLRALKARFEKNMQRHAGVAWADVQAKVEGDLHSDRYERWRPQAVNRMSLAKIRTPLTSPSVTAPQKVL